MNYPQKGKSSPRLSGFDYSTQGAYFITINCKNRIRQFGKIVDEKMQLSPIGSIVEEEWLKGSELRLNIALDEYQIMPDHFHAIVWIHKDQILDLPNYPLLPQSPGYKFDQRNIAQNLNSMIRFFKGSVTKIARREGFFNFAWQRSFHDRIIRNQAELERIRLYIKNNPSRWNKH